jgi:hypothetical protein
MPISTPTTDQLKKAIQLAEQIQRLEAELAQLLGKLGGKVSAPAPVTPKAGKAAKKKNTMSAAGRARIVAAQKARWAKIKAEKAAAAAPAKSAPTPKAAAKAASTSKKKGTLTPEGRAKLAALMKARWAARKKGASAPNTPAKKA